jgi:hypothetical protein
MFEPSKLKRLAVKDVNGGNLVFTHVDQTQRLGMVVQMPGEEDEKGVLFFPPVPWAGNLSASPFFSWQGERVIDLGVTGEFLWGGNGGALSDSFHQIPSDGHLVVTKDGVCISGRMQTGWGRTVYWDVKNGKLRGNQSVAGESFIFISEWSVGWRDVDGDFRELARFPPVPSTK